MASQATRLSIRSAVAVAAMAFATASVPAQGDEYDAPRAPRMRAPMHRAMHMPEQRMRHWHVHRHWHGPMDRHRHAGRPHLHAGYGVPADCGGYADCGGPAPIAPPVVRADVEYVHFIQPIIHVRRVPAWYGAGCGGCATYTVQQVAADSAGCGICSHRVVTPYVGTRWWSYPRYGYGYGHRHHRYWR